jgi:hypothetical protein
LFRLAFLNLKVYAMKKIAILTILILSIISNTVSGYENPYECGLIDTSGLRSSYPTCAYSSYGTNATWQISGVYLTAESAMAARDAKFETLSNDSANGYGRNQSGPSCYSSGVTGGGFNGSVWCYYTCAGWRCANGVTTYITNYYYLYPNPDWYDGNGDCVADEGVDRDEDGIIDDSDPYPDDSSCFKFNVFYWAWCDEAVVGIKIETDKGDAFEYGYVRNSNNECEGDFHTRMDININAGGGTDYEYDCNDLNGLLTGGTGPTVDDANTTDEVDLNEDGSVDVSVPNQETGTSVDSSNTQTENTAATANNTEKILDAINKGNEINLGTQKLTTELLKQSESVQSSIENTNQTISDAFTTTGTIGDFGSLNKDLYKQDGSFTEGDEYNSALDNKISEVSPDGTIGSVVNNAMNNSVITNFKNSHIQITSPSSVFSFDFSALGHTQTFSFDLSRWAGILSTAGNVFYTITLVLGFVVVLRGH